QTAAAAPPTPQPSPQKSKAKQEALEHFEKGKVAFRLRDHNTAINEWRAAYQLDPDPVFLYNIAQGYRELHDFANAVAFYKNYLREAPDAPNRATVEKRIGELTEALDRERQAAEKPPSEPIKPGAKN